MAEHKILIVDDDPEIREMLSNYLGEKGYLVTAIPNGSEALSYLQEDLPHLIITDLLLPGEHGLDLVREVKKNWYIPTIVLSGIYSRKEIDTVMGEESVEAFFEKPVDLSRLHQTIVKLLDE